MNVIELTQEQSHFLRIANGDRPRIIDPRTKEQFVLVPIADYQRLTDEEYDDGPWTEEERDLLRAEACEMLDSFGK